MQCGFFTYLCAFFCAFGGGSSLRKDDGEGRSSLLGRAVQWNLYWRWAPPTFGTSLYALNDDGDGGGGDKIVKLL
jgi:hypothetical protein